MICGPRILPAELQKFEDQRLGPTSDAEYVLPKTGGQRLSREDKAQLYLAEMCSYFWQQRQGLIQRLGFALGLAWLLGMIAGVVVPRFTTIVGTSLLGALGLGIGVSVLLSLHWPILWSGVVTKTAWFLGALGLFLVVSLSFQIRHGRPPASSLPAPAVGE